ncbi:hypothetical protein AB0M29_04490 [Streptomyces sp. NPDC051976]|uniref:hypothetical protein n=1 Tax=Streptomyces sp. NPDC051976 TaxID=3154947 RepID=UPI0034283985
MRVRIIAVGIAAAVTAGAGWLALPARGSHDPAESARARQLTLILAGAAPVSEAIQFDLDMAAREESLIAQCMRQAGLSYTPKDPHALVDTSTRTDFTSLAYARQRGFGISSWPAFAKDQAGSAGNAGGAGTNDNSNSAYRGRQASCSDRADTTAEAEFGIKPGNDRYTEVDDRIHQQAAYRTAAQKWKSCAAAHGVDASSRLGLITSLRARYAGVLASLKSSAGGTGSIADLAAASAKDPAYQKFKTDEIRVATATFACSQGFDATYVHLFLQVDQPAAT